MCQKVKQADSAYIAGTYGRFDAVMSKGEGAHYEGPDGKRYICLLYTSPSPRDA